MKKLVLAGIGVLAVGLLILSSQANVVGYQTIQTSQQNLIKERINQKELLLQTICDLVNNKDIQRIILTSEMNNKGFFTPSMNTLPINAPILTKRQLEFAYHLGLFLTRLMSKTKMSSMIKQHQVPTQDVQKNILRTINKDTRLSKEINQLSTSDCHCKIGINDNLRSFPAICNILYALCSVSKNILGDFILYSGSYLLLYTIGLVFMGIYLITSILYLFYFNCGDWPPMLMKETMIH